MGCSIYWCGNKKMKKAAIIIVNWNGKKFLKNLLDSVFKQTYKSFDVYLVDNGSIDESSEYVKKTFPKIKIIQLDKNYGFAKGNNEGIKEAFKDKKVEYIVCLNNDTIVDKNWLRELIKTTEKKENIGAVQSKIFLEDQKTIHSTGSLINWDFSSSSRDFGKVSQYSNEEGEIESAIGCSLLLKRKVLDRIGLYEEFYKSYKEDDEICLKIKKANFKVFYSPSSIVYHLHSKTFGRQSIEKIYLNERNRIFNLLTFGSFSQIIFSIFYTLRRYLRQKEELQKEKKNIYFKLRLFIIIFKANIVALFLIPKFLIKRWKM